MMPIQHPTAKVISWYMLMKILSILFNHYLKQFQSYKKSCYERMRNFKNLGLPIFYVPNRFFSTRWHLRYSGCWLLWLLGGCGLGGFQLDLFEALFLWELRSAGSLPRLGLRHQRLSKANLPGGVQQITAYTQAGEVVGSACGSLSTARRPTTMWGAVSMIRPKSTPKFSSRRRSLCTSAVFMR